MNPPLHKFWLNPFLRRYAVARLRWQPVLIWGLVVQSLAAFGWLAAFHGSRLFGQSSAAEAALRAWVPILFLQGLLLFVKGTFSVAVGVAREHAEGLSDAQRLTPLPPGHKVLGSLLGLPILDSLLAASLLPWTLASVFLGHIPLETVIRIHLLLGTSAVLHHTIGLVSGTVIRQKIAAGTVSQLLVILLHVIIPLFSKFGVGTLGHLGIETTIAAELSNVSQSAYLRKNLDVAFFHLNLSAAGYQWVAMVLLLALLVLVLRRRWIRAEAHLLSKPLALLCMLALLVSSLGELTPDLRSGVSLKPPKFLLRQLEHAPVLLQTSQQALFPVTAMVAFGSIGLYMALLLSTCIAPGPLEIARATQSRGFAAPHPDSAADARSSLPACVAMAGMAHGAWLFLIEQVKANPVFQILLSAAPNQPAWILLAILFPLLSWSMLIELRGRKFAVLLMLSFWLAAPMTATVCSLAGVPFDSWPRWLFASSGLALPSIALINSFKIAPTNLHLPWLVSTGFHAGLCLVLGILILARNRRLKTSAIGPSRS